VTAEVLQLHETRKCKTCGQEKSVRAFDTVWNGYKNYLLRACRECRKTGLVASKKYNKTSYQTIKKDLRKFLLLRTRASASTRGLECRLTLDDIFIPTHCPILGIELTGPTSKGEPRPPSLMSVDRIDSTKGYIKGNVAVISFRANMLKNNGTAEEHERIAAWMRAQEAVR